MKKQINIITFLSFALLFNVSYLKAQEDINCGIIIDSIKADKIDCWTFEKMYLIFPVQEAYKKYDLIELRLRLGANMKENPDEDRVFFQKFTPQTFGDNFVGGKYGVWKILTDKNKDAIQSGLCHHVSLYYTSAKRTRKSFSVVHDKKDIEGSFAQVELVGYTITGYQIDSYGNKVPTYSEGIFLYKSTKVPTKVKYGGANETGLAYKSTPFDINEVCPVTGTKLKLKIEQSPAYAENFGIIK